MKDLHLALRRVGGGFFDPGEELGVAVGALDGGGDEAFPDDVGLVGDEAFDACAGFLMAGGIAHDAAGADLFAAEFKLWFDEHESGTAELERFERGRENEGERDEGDIGHDDVHGLGEVLGFHVADVEIFSGDDSGVAAEFPDQLIGADIVGIDAARAVLKQAVGKAAGGRPDIESNGVFYRKLKGFERTFELEPTTADVARRFFD